MTRLLAVPLDASDVFLMTFMILQDSYMEPTRVGSDRNKCSCVSRVYDLQKHIIASSLDTANHPSTIHMTPSIVLTLAKLRLIYFDYLSWATDGGGMIMQEFRTGITAEIKTSLLQSSQLLRSISQRFLVEALHSKKK